MYVFVFFLFFDQILRCLVLKTCFLVTPGKTMQNHLEISSKLSFGPETCEIGPKVGTWTCPSCPKSSKRRQKNKTPCLQTSNAPKEGEALQQNNTFSFLKTTQSFVLLNKFITFIKSSVLLSRFFTFKEKNIGFTKQMYYFFTVIGFTKQIYEDKSLSQNHVFTSMFFRFMPSIFY